MKRVILRHGSVSKLMKRVILRHGSKVST